MKSRFLRWIDRCAAVIDRAFHFDITHEETNSLLRKPQRRAARERDHTQHVAKLPGD